MNAATLDDAVGAFLRSREALGCTAATMRTYAANLDAFRRNSGSADLSGMTTAGVHAGRAFVLAWSAKVLALPRRAEQVGIVNGNRAGLDRLCREVLDEIARWDVGGSPAPRSAADGR